MRPPIFNTNGNLIWMETAELVRLKNIWNLLLFCFQILIIFIEELIHWGIYCSIINIECINFKFLNLFPLHSRRLACILWLIHVNSWWKFYMWKIISALTHKNSKFKHKQLEKKRFQGHRLHWQKSEELYKVINNVVEVVDEKSSKPTN